MMLQIVSLSFCSLSFCVDKYYANAQPYQPSPEREERITSGAWVPAQFRLEQMKGVNQMNALYTLRAQGFDEYYYVMRDFNNAVETDATEALLKLTDKTNLKVTIIILPPGEGGSHANYDWKGWMTYFNSLKERHPSSFLGFAVDDMNAIVDIRRVYIMNNMDLMGLSNFSSALPYKREDVQFYPVMYIETGEFETLKKKYGKYITGIILVNTLYHNVSFLEKNFAKFSDMFENKPIKYIVYPTKSGCEPPSDRLIMATLSIASRWVDGIIVYVDTDHPIIQDYLQNHKDLQYMSAIKEMERLQINHEVESPKDIVDWSVC